MKKLFAVALSTMLVAGLAFSQGMPGKGMMSLGIGAQLSIPTASAFSDVNSMGYGGSGRFQYGLEKNISLYGQIGYMYWPGKNDVSGFDFHTTGLEFLAGGKYGFGQGFYGLGELGITSFTVTTKYTDPFTGLSYDASGSDSNFMFGLGVGYVYQAWSAEVKYYLLDSDFANLGIRVGYDFAL